MPNFLAHLTGTSHIPLVERRPRSPKRRIINCRCPGHGQIVLLISAFERRAQAFCFPFHTLISWDSLPDDSQPLLFLARLEIIAFQWQVKHEVMSPGSEPLSKHTDFPMSLPKLCVFNLSNSISHSQMTVPLDNQRPGKTCLQAGCVDWVCIDNISRISHLTMMNSFLI